MSCVESAGALAHTSGMTLGEVLKAARADRTQGWVGSQIGVTRVAVGNWEKGDNYPSTENLIVLCRVLGIDMQAALAGRLEPSFQPTHQSAATPVENPRRARDAGDGVAVATLRPFGAGAYRNDVEVRGTVAGSDGASFCWEGGVIDYVRRPPGIENVASAFALYVIGESMSPRFEHGELVYVNPSRPARSGDDVVIEMAQIDGEGSGRGFVKRLVRQTPQHVVVEQFNPPLEIKLDKKAVKSVLRIMPWGELLGV